jgi:sporulation protein YtfJ
MSEKNHPISDLMSTTLQKIKEMVDVNTIVGQPIQTAEGITLIPISKLSFGFASGGSDFTGKHQKPDSENAFGGGGGAGVNISPVGFLVVKGDSVKMLPIAPPPSTTVDRVVEMVPNIIDKVTEFIEQNKKDKETF